MKGLHQCCIYSSSQEPSNIAVPIPAKVAVGIPFRLPLQLVATKSCPNCSICYRISSDLFLAKMKVNFFPIFVMGSSDLSPCQKKNTTQSQLITVTFKKIISQFEMSTSSVGCGSAAVCETDRGSECRNTGANRLASHIVGRI